MAGFLRVKDLEKLQHYKDRSPPWIKLHANVLDDYEFGRLPDASKAHLLAINLLASRYDNRIPADAEWIGRRINATGPVDLALLIGAGFLIADQACSETLAGRKQPAMPETETETETETEKIPPPSGAPPTVVDPTGMQQAVDEWNRLAPALGLATTRWPLSKDRAQKLRARLTDCGGIEGWLAALEKVRRSPLLNGTAPRSGKHANWRCSFDFLIRAEAFERLMEGKYDGRSGLADIAEQHAAIDRALGLEAGG